MQEYKNMLSIISYNVMFNDVCLIPRHKALIALIRKNKADIVCLQEVLSDLTPWFIQALADLYTPVFTTLQPTGRGYGELVFVEKGIQQKSFQSVELPGKMGRALQHVTVEKDGMEYNIITFHLESMNCKRVRRQQLEIMWEHASKLTNVICCGDTNQTDKEVCTVPEGFVDAWEQTDGNIGAHTYFSGRFWDGDRKQRYDKAWLSTDLQLYGFGALGNKPINDQVWISDHDGLFVLCGLKEP